MIYNDLWCFFSCDYRNTRSWTVQTFGETSPKLQSFQWPCDTRSLTLWTGTWSQQRPSIEKNTFCEWSPDWNTIVTYFLTYHLKVHMAYLFWHSFWPIFQHSFWHSMWHLFWYAFWHIFILTFFLAFYLVYLRRFFVVEVQRGTLWSGARGGGPAEAEEDAGQLT